MPNKRILMVEDEYIIADDLARQLAKHNVDTVAFAPTLERALEIASTGLDFDGAVLDVRLPGGDVFPLATLLRRWGKMVVFFTGVERESIPAELNSIPIVDKLADARTIVKALFGDTSLAVSKAAALSDVGTSA